MKLILSFAVAASFLFLGALATNADTSQGNAQTTDPGATGIMGGGAPGKESSDFDARKSMEARKRKEKKDKNKRREKNRSKDLKSKR